MADDKLTPKQELFIREYLIDLNATQAYKRAGYKVKNDAVAGVMGHRLLKNDKIMRAVEEENNKRKEKLELSAEWVLENLKNIAEKCQQAEPVLNFNYDTKQLEETGEYKFDSQGANRALELIGKHLKMFTDKVETSGEVFIGIQLPEGLEDK